MQQKWIFIIHDIIDKIKIIYTNLEIQIFISDLKEFSHLSTTKIIFVSLQSFILLYTSLMPSKSMPKRVIMVLRKNIHIFVWVQSNPCSCFFCRRAAFQTAKKTHDYIKFGRQAKTILIVDTRLHSLNPKSLNPFKT